MDTKRKLLGSAQARRADYVLQHGSLPLTGDLARLVDAYRDTLIKLNPNAAGIGDDSWAQFCRQLRSLGARVLLDSSGTALQQALALPAAELPWLIKPNQHELEQYLGRTLASRDELLPALERLRRTIDAQAVEWAGLVKVGRTHLQDAVPLTLGQEASAWSSQLEQAQQGWLGLLAPVHQLAIGGTAVGTGLNAHPLLAEHMVAALAEATGLRLVRAPNAFAAQSAHDALVAAHGGLRTLAVVLMKIANDLRWLASGPRCGLGELVLPANEPGSSIMPGKVNPSQCESLIMVAAQVMGNDVTMGWAGTLGHFQLNTALPLMAHNLLHSLQLLARGTHCFEQHCVRGIAPQPRHMADQVARNLMLATALVPHLGHDDAVRVAQRAQADGSTLREAALACGRVTPAQFDAWVRPEDMTGRPT